MRRSKIRFLVVVMLGSAAPLAVACSSSSSGDTTGFDAGGGDSSMFVGDSSHDTGAVKPTPKPVEAGARDAAPNNKPDASRPTGAGDGGPLLDAGGVVPPATGDGDPLDPIDESLMPTDGLDVDTCVDANLTDSTGRCYNDSFSGADYVEGCVDPEAYLLDCARYDTAGSTRSICEDDPSEVGCVLINVATVASFEASQTASATDQNHACPSNWEGYGYCDGDFVSMCVGGEDYWLDCSIYDTGGFTYTCGTDGSGNIACQ